MHRNIDQSLVQIRVSERLSVQQNALRAFVYGFIRLENVFICNKQSADAALRLITCYRVFWIDFVTSHGLRRCKLIALCENNP